MKVLALALVAVAAMANVAVAPASASTGTTAGSTIGRDNVAPCQDGNPPAPGKRCRGPVDNESGGGGTGLTIAVSVVVGLGIAAVAFIVLRRQLATHHPSGATTPARTTGEQP